jgi:hypothetical protein
MQMFKNRVLPVVIGAGVVVGAANIGAYAANGHPLLLGHTNDETSTATVVNHGPGPALSLTTRNDVPPLEVGSQAKVRRLNADRVDGINGGQVTAYTYSLPQIFDTQSFDVTFPKLPSGHHYVASYWLQADMKVANDGIVCELATQKLHGDPGGEDLAISASRHDFDATAGASAYVSTRNRSVDLGCHTDSNTANIDSVFFGQVTFVPVGKAHVAQAKPLL